VVKGARVQPRKPAWRNQGIHGIQQIWSRYLSDRRLSLPASSLLGSLYRLEAPLVPLEFDARTFSWRQLLANNKHLSERDRVYVNDHLPPTKVDGWGKRKETAPETKKEKDTRFIFLAPYSSFPPLACAAC
jgi:hypothetical protein